MQGIGGVADQFLEKPGEGQGENGREKQGQHGGDENGFFLHQIAQNPTV
jgi:hypothetical protein